MTCLAVSGMAEDMYVLYNACTKLKPL